MADSENSRTLSAITRGKKDPGNDATEILPDIINRRNLLSVAARLLSARVAEPGEHRNPIGPTPIKEMWPRWYGCHQQRVKATRLKKKLEKALLEEAGRLPVATLRNVGEEGVVEVHSFADISRMASELDVERLSQARSELRRRRRQWKEADRRLGYSTTVALEHQLAERAGILGRVMWITPPSSVIEVIAKFHCLIVMHDSGLKLEDAPWPELRTTLKDLIRLSQKCRPKSCYTPANPDKAADVKSILNLAAQYQVAARDLTKGSPRSNHAPLRLLALHAMELYLDAFLRAQGVNSTTIRSCGHDLGERTRMATEAGLVLRKRTVAHLATLSASNEYHIIRYAPEPTSTPSQLNRIMATIDEISRKVRKALRASS